jgi:hypothetical protein
MFLRECSRDKCISSAAAKSELSNSEEDPKPLYLDYSAVLTLDYAME